MNIAKAEQDQKLGDAETYQQVEAAQKDYQDMVNDAFAAFEDSLKDFVQKTIERQPQEVAQKLETFKAQEEKASIEDDIRSHLRGFSRTIPSFIMAYGDRNLTLSNFDDYTEDDVFKEVTGISEDEFRFLRDGGDYEDPNTGELCHFTGHLFDEVVFNDSIQEFLDKREELANYFDESHTEDIFDYIPPQKTFQIFTPRWVVKKMVDELEIQNPGCYDDPNATFADLYMKSGLYMTEIVKRLFTSRGLRNAYPNEEDRIRHILDH